MLAPVNADDRVGYAMVRHLIIQAARDAEIQLADLTDIELRDEILRLMREVSESEWEAHIQSEHQPRLIQAARRFLDEDDPELAIVMYATAAEHWVNGMLEVGLRRRGEQLDQTTERGSLSHKLDARWPELLGPEFPADLRKFILKLAAARNAFVHYKWPSHSEDEHHAHAAEVAAIARDTPRILAALSELEDSIVFGGAREQLDRVLDNMGLAAASIGD